MERTQTELVHKTGVRFKVFLTKYEYERAQTDVDFGNELVEKYYTLHKKNLVTALPNKSTCNIIEQENKENEQAESDTTFRWTDEEIKFLINEYRILFGRSNKPKDPKKTNKALYIEISNKFLTKNKSITWQQIETKIKGLLKTYKNIKDNDRSTGRGTIRWPYFDLFDEFMADRPEVVPLSLSSNLQETVFQTSDTEEVPDVNSDADASTSTPSVNRGQRVRKRRYYSRTEAEEPQWFKQFRLDSERRHNERMEAISKLNHTLEMLVTDKNTLD